MKSFLSLFCDEFDSFGVNLENEINILVFDFILLTEVCPIEWYH